MIWEEKESAKIKAVEMDNLRGLLGIRCVWCEEKGARKDCSSVIRLYGENGE